MKRLAHLFGARRAEGRKVLSLYVTPGYPTPATTVPLILALERAGADLIELGIAFSDPIADGPTIQESSTAALANGMTLEGTFEIARALRAASDIPLLLMGYANPVYAYGPTRFVQTCAALGVDGTIIPDLSLEESSEFRALSAEHGLASVLLAAPTTPDERLARLDEATSGFLYCVSVAGVTGARSGVADSTVGFMERARAHVRRHPLMVGFGIATPEDARAAAAHADGVIIGSALVKLLGHGTVDDAARFTGAVRAALDRGAT
jgi:tryptophan synthase alpha chain